MAQVTFPALQKKIVYYDLKTTDSKSVPTREIVSIGAICNFSTDISLFFGNGIGHFFVEIPPTHGINPKRSKLYGYTIQNEKLFYTDKNGSKFKKMGSWSSFNETSFGKIHSIFTFSKIY